MVFMDNAGLILAGIFRPRSTGAKVVNGILREDTGASFGTSVYQTSTNTTIYNVSPIKSVQIGESSTPATRQDFKIADPFSVAPEASPFSSLNGGYNSGLGKIEIPATLASTGGAGTIKEVVKRAQVRDTFGGATNRTIIFLRDVIQDSSFIIGQSVSINHEVFI